MLKKNICIYLKNTKTKFLFSKQLNINFCEKLKDDFTSKNKDYASFGFKTVKKEEKQGLVNSVFANVAKRYSFIKYVAMI
jgi:hypothetical protein